MRVLAIDQATKSGWCFGTTEVPTLLPLKDWKFGRFVAPKRPELGERLSIIRKNVIALVREYTPDLVAYEEPYSPLRELIEAAAKGDKTRLGKFNLETTNFLQQVKAAVAMGAADAGVPTEIYPPRSWRITVLGSGNTRPPDGNTDPKWIKKAVFNRMVLLGAAVTNEDESDACGICMHACFGKPAALRAQGDLLAL